MEELIYSCRMCLETSGQFVTLDCELDASTPNITFFDAYNFCTNLSADLDDPFPSIICKQCSRDLKFVYEVLQKALRSDLTLRDIFEKQLFVIEVDATSNSEKSSKENEIAIEDRRDSISEIRLEDVEGDTMDGLSEHLYVEVESTSGSEVGDQNDTEHNNINQTVEGCEKEGSLIISSIKSENEDTQEATKMHLEQVEPGKPEEAPNLEDDLQKNSSSHTSESEENQKKQRTRKAPPKTWCCEICGKFFSGKQKLTAHHLVHTKEKKFACKLCPKRFPTIFRYRYHMNSHDNIRSHECRFCKEKFLTKSTLQCHLRRHTGERPYKCDTCGKSFTQSSILKTHVALHTGKTVECNMCNKKFTRPSHLILHQRSHTGERPYQCTFCPNRYRQKSHLDRHLDTHMGVKHTCDVCGKSYTKKSSLNTHKFVHSVTKHFKCSECFVEFSTKDRLIRHCKSVHKRLPTTKIEI